MDEPLSEEFVNTQFAATTLGLTRQGVIWLIHTKKLAAQRLGKQQGGRYLLRRVDVERLREARDNVQR